jgi:hypothetical protein
MERERGERVGTLHRSLESFFVFQVHD